MSMVFWNALAGIAIVVLAIAAISFLPGFLAALFETRMVWPYEAASEFKNSQTLRATRPQIRTPRRRSKITLASHLMPTRRA